MILKALYDYYNRCGNLPAFGMEEKEIGVICAAAPVLGANNTAIAAISLSGPSFRMTEQNLITVSEELKKAAKAIRSLIIG